MKKDVFDIIVQGGQSNAVGYGLGPVEKEFIPKENIVYLYDGSGEALCETGLDEACETQPPFVMIKARERTIEGMSCGDFALSFAEDYIKEGLLSSQRKLLIIKAAVGGTSFQEGFWGLEDKLYRRLLKMVQFALAQNPENKVVAFLWHQGESDADKGNTSEQYKLQLTNLLKDFRRNFGVQIPFIAGDFVNDWKSKNLSICEPIVDVIRQVVKEEGNTGFVETLDLLSNDQKINNGDNIHFCREALHQLGNRYFKIFQKLKEKNGSASFHDDI